MSSRSNSENLNRIVNAIRGYVDIWVENNHTHLADIHRIDFYMHPGDSSLDYHQVTFSCLSPNVTHVVMTVDLDHSRIVNAYSYIGY